MADWLVYALIFIIVVLLAILIYRNRDAISRNVPAMAFDVAPGGDAAMRNVINGMPEMIVPGGAEYRGVVGAAHIYAADGRTYKMYPLCCDMCRARAVYWTQRHVAEPLAVPCEIGYATARPDGCFSQRHFTDDCDPVRRYLVQRYEEYEPLTCGWAAEHRNELKKIAETHYSTVLENCAVYDGQLRILHLDLPKFPKTSAVSEYLEVNPVA